MITVRGSRRSAVSGYPMRKIRNRDMRNREERASSLAPFSLALLMGKAESRDRRRPEIGGIFDALSLSGVWGKGMRKDAAPIYYIRLEGDGQGQ